MRCGTRGARTPVAGGNTRSPHVARKTPIPPNDDLRQRCIASRAHGARTRVLMPAWRCPAGRAPAPVPRSSRRPVPSRGARHHARRGIAGQIVDSAATPHRPARRHPLPPSRPSEGANLARPPTGTSSTQDFARAHRSCRAATTFGLSALRMRIACIHDGEPLYGDLRSKLNLIPMSASSPPRDRPSTHSRSGCRARLFGTVRRADRFAPGQARVPERNRARIGEPGRWSARRSRRAMNNPDAGTASSP